MINEHGNGLAYTSDRDNVSIYAMMMDHRVVFYVTVDNEDAELKIRVHTHDWNYGYETNGKAIKGVHEVGGTHDTPGDLKDHIDGMSIQNYVYPRLPIILANLYVPKLDPNITIPDDPSAITG